MVAAPQEEGLRVERLREDLGEELRLCDGQGSLDVRQRGRVLAEEEVEARDLRLEARDVPIRLVGAEDLERPLRELEGVLDASQVPERRGQRGSGTRCVVRPIGCEVERSALLEPADRELELVARVGELARALEEP